MLDLLSIGADFVLAGRIRGGVGFQGGETEVEVVSREEVDVVLVIEMQEFSSLIGTMIRDLQREMRGLNILKTLGLMKLKLL